MWQETKHGLYKQFSFQSFHEAWGFMQRVVAALEHDDYYPRWQNERNVVDIWLAAHEQGVHITDRDRHMAELMDGLVMSSANSQRAYIVEDKTTIITELQLYADGGSRGNPGPSSSGYVLLNMDDE